MLSIVVLAAAVALASPASPADKSCTPKSFGKGVELTETTATAALLDHPSEWAGRRVRVEGEVAAVCEMAGCWMELRAQDQGRSVRVKVDDGVMVFPVAARGRRAVAEGIVEVRQLDRAGYLRLRHHEADEQGTSFDESTAGEGPFQTIEVHGTGAEICL